jgi:hypothetical protein
MKFRVSGTIFINGVSTGGNRDVQDWTEVMPHLINLHETSGTLRLSLIDAPEPGPISMQVRSENKTHLVTLFEDTGDDTNVRAYDNPTAIAEMVDIVGDYWDARMLTNDFDLVVMMFKEFFETGDVSREWLS